MTGEGSVESRNGHGQPRSQRRSFSFGKLIPCTKVGNISALCAWEQKRMLLEKAIHRFRGKAYPESLENRKGIINLDTKQLKSL
jgi:hypothetical protein